MKKLKIFLTVFVVFTFTPAIAQTFGNIRVYLSPGGYPIYNPDNKPAFEVPLKDDNDPFAKSKYSLYASSLWLAGLDSLNVLRVAGQTYISTGGPDFISGPINPVTHQPVDTFDVLWPMKKADALNHAQNPSSSNDDINKWPGTYTDKNKTFSLAPYIDIDSNGVYEPLKGDYPDVKGDMNVFFVYNDSAVHLETKSEPLGIQVHGLAYSFNSTNEEWLKHCLFIDYTISNFSSRNYKDFFASVWVDFDLGNPSDDYIGTDTNRNMVFTYNGYAVDSGFMGYGYNPPAMGVITLNQKLNSSIYYNNDITDIKAGNPTHYSMYYNLMKGLWLDGSPMHNKGTGIQNTGEETRFVYSGDACGLEPWSEYDENNSPGDRRILANFKLNDLKHGDKKTITVAYLWSRFLPGNFNNTGSVCKLTQQADSLITWYNKKFPPAINTGITTASKPNIKIYPNPSSSLVNVIVPEGSDLKATLFDMHGRAIIKDCALLFSVETINKGIYFLSGTLDGQPFTERLSVY